MKGKGQKRRKKKRYIFLERLAISGVRNKREREDEICRKRGGRGSEGVGKTLTHPRSPSLHLPSLLLSGVRPQLLSR